MTEPRIADLFDRAAAGDIEAPPVDDLVRRGTARRRTHVWLAAATTVAVIGAFVGAGLAIQNADSERPTPDIGSPSPAPSSTQALAGPTAQQLAKGQWHSIAAPPFTLCPGSTMTTWGDNRLLVESRPCRGLYAGASTAVYDPTRDAWSRLPDVPRGGEWLGVVDDSFVIVSTGAGTAYRIPVPSVSRGADVMWSRLPPLPETSADGFRSSITTVGDSIVVAGTGADGTGVWQFDDGAWHALPRLPVPDPYEVVQLTLTTFNGRLYAFAGVGGSRPERGGAFEPRVLMLADDAWVEQPRPDGVPLLVSHAESYESHIWILGSNCPPYSSCPFTPRTPVGLYDPANGDYVDLSHSGAYDVTRVGGALVGYNPYTRLRGGAIELRPGDTSVWDRERGWLEAPTSGRVQGFATTAGTPHGFIVLADGDTGSLILRPAE